MCQSLVPSFVPCCFTLGIREYEALPCFAASLNECFCLHFEAAWAGLGLWVRHLHHNIDSTWPQTHHGLYNCWSRPLHHQPVIRSVAVVAAGEKYGIASFREKYSKDFRTSPRSTAPRRGLFRRPNWNIFAVFKTIVKITLSMTHLIKKSSTM